MNDTTSRKSPAGLMGSPLLAVALAALLVQLGALTGCGSKDSSAADGGQVGVRNESAAQTQDANASDGTVEPAPSTDEAAPAVGEAPANADESTPAAGSDMEGESTDTPSDSKTSESGSGT